jgi:hypothetical protein
VEWLLYLNFFLSKSPQRRYVRGFDADVSAMQCFSGMNQDAFHSAVVVLIQ